MIEDPFASRYVHSSCEKGVNVVAVFKVIELSLKIAQLVLVVFGALFVEISSSGDCICEILA